jgi:hypothetical protein
MRETVGLRKVGEGLDLGKRDGGEKGGTGLGEWGRRGAVKRGAMREGGESNGGEQRVLPERNGLREESREREREKGRSWDGDIAMNER